MTPGRDYVGVGVGAMIFDAEGRVFLARRGPAARNEVGCWEFPGGGVEFGERLTDAVVREFHEEYGVSVEVDSLLSVFDHILPAEHQHWVSPTYIGRLVAGTPMIAEPEKITEIGWFSLSDLPAPLTAITRENVRSYRDALASPRATPRRPGPSSGHVAPA